MHNKQLQAYEKEALMEKVKRLNPTWDTRRQLFLLSMNKCTFPNCTHNIVDQFGHFIGEICHIEAANEDGERFNPYQSNEDRRHISNLVLMCPTHHKVTNNVEIYDVEKLREIKASHEKAAFNDNAMANLSSIFADRALGEIVVFPRNLEELDISDFERSSQTFFKDAQELIGKIAALPRLTRSFYAHALLRATIDDLSICFDPRELETRLEIDSNTVFHHVAILNRSGLLSELDNDEYPTKLAYWFTTFDSEDNQIWLLALINRKFSGTPQAFLDIFESLNFNRLEL